MDRRPPTRGTATSRNTRSRSPRTGAPLGATFSTVLEYTTHRHSQTRTWTRTPPTTTGYQPGPVHGLGPYSNVASATTHSVPQPPTNLRASASGTERINLSWRAPSDRGSSSITGYRVETSASGLGFYDGSWEEVVANTRSTSYSHTNLRPSTVHHYRVFAINASGTKQELGEDLGRHQGYAKPGPLHKHEPHEGRS